MSTRPICLRVDSEMSQEVARRARLLGVTPADYIRGIIKDSFDGNPDSAVLEKNLSPIVTQESDRLLSQIDAVNANIDHLRKGLARGVEILLMSTGKVKKEEAKSWVDRNIRK